jgi:hypothetical protein
MIYNTLRAKGFSKQTANILSNLTTINNKDSVRQSCLPEGTPTSPTLANIVLEKVDKKLLKIIEGHKIYYTRWVDDLTFSSNTCFLDLVPELLSLIGNNGFKISRDKTTYKHKRTLITGAVVYKRLNVSKIFRILDQKETNINKIIGRRNYRNQIYKANQKTMSRAKT